MKYGISLVGETRFVGPPCRTDFNIETALQEYDITARPTVDGLKNYICKCLAQIISGLVVLIHSTRRVIYFSMVAQSTIDMARARKQVMPRERCNAELTDR